MPTTAAFLHAIARLPHGAVVLPGLDRDLDAAAWQAIGGGVDAAGEAVPALASHPQFALHSLLARFGLTREEVEDLAPPAAHGRELLTSEALRPSAATAEWHRRLAQPDSAARIAAGMRRLAVIAAPTPEAEALAIAVALREAHEHGRSAALVTPDRALARRVMAALGRWSVPFDDSGGAALAETPAGLFARLAAAAVAEGLPPATLLALLKHPLTRLGQAEGACAAAVATLELALFRGPRPAATCAALSEALVAFRHDLANLKAGRPATLHASEPRARVDAAARDRVAALIERLAAALAPVEGL
jgi:ATP-dependent helicase/nuclease subunit B